MTTPQFEVSDAPTDVISAVKFAPESLRLLVSSWDKHVYLYELENGSSKLLQRFEHRAPVLDVCWGENEDTLYSAGLDWDVRRIDRKSGSQTILSSHTAGVKSLAFSPVYNLLISSSWDLTLHIHDVSPNSEHPPISVHLPHKPFSISVSQTKLVVALAARALHIYDLQSLSSFFTATTEAALAGSSIVEASVEPWQRRESSLRFMTRCVACAPDDSGYASSSIEGRVAVEWFDPSAESQARKYAFKCHRQPATDGSGVDTVYPVNALAFHPVHGTFASGGGDGMVAIWDGLLKRRIRQYQRYQSSVAALTFSHDGKWLAVGTSPGFEDGKEVDEEGMVKLFIREIGPNEAKGKGTK